MESAIALWLNSAFAGYDHAILSLMHKLAEVLGVVLTPLMKIITLLGEKGLIFFLLALLFILFSGKRDLGVCIFGAVCCGALITNIILKDNVARLRPFEASGEFLKWWQFIGAPAEDGYSFPSGHVTACAAGMTAICTMKGRKWVLPSVIIVLLMAVSRNYLMAHYPSDVLFAVIIGVVSGLVAWVITQLIFRFLEDHDDRPLCELLLDFDISEVLPFALPAFLTGADSTGDEDPAEEKPAKAAKAVKAAKPAAQNTGRHSAAGSAPAKKGWSIPGSYKGKHEL